MYEEDKGNIVGLLFVKSLIMLDPERGTPIKDIYKAGSFLKSSTTEPLFELLDKFQTGRSKCDSVDYTGCTFSAVPCSEYNS